MLAIQEFMNNNKHNYNNNFVFGGGTYFHSSDNYNRSIF